MERDYSSVGQRVGLAAVGTAGLLSAISTSVLLCYMLYCLTIGKHRSPLTTGVNKFVRSALGRYLVALLISDFFQGLAFAMNYHWARMGRMYEGKTCVAQGVTSEFGDLGAAMWSLIIAFHTFWLLFLQRKPSEWISNLTLLITISFLIIMPFVGTYVIQRRGLTSFWGLSGAWCWIGGEYQIERLVYLYLWIFMNLICSLVLYSLIYMKFASIIEYDPSKTISKRLAWKGWMSGGRSKRWTTTPNTQPSNEGSEVSDGSSGHVSNSLVSIARRLMWYPIVYAFVVIPVSICRLGVMMGWEPPFELFVFAGVCFSSSGLTNTILFIFTRHSLIQRITRPQGIRVTTHKLTVTDAGNPPISGKAFPLDELRSQSTPRAQTETVRYAVQFEASTVSKKKQDEFDGDDAETDLEDPRQQTVLVNGRRQYNWAYTP